MQENNDDNCREHQAEKDGVADALDGVLHDSRLVIKRKQTNAGRKRAANAVYLRMDFISHGNGVAVRLAIDVQQHRRFSIGAHDGIKRRNRWLHRGHISNPHRNACGSALDHSLRHILRAARLSRDQP